MRYVTRDKNKKKMTMKNYHFGFSRKKTPGGRVSVIRKWCLEFSIHIKFFKVNSLWVSSIQSLSNWYEYFLPTMLRYFAFEFEWVVYRWTFWETQTTRPTKQLFFSLSIYNFDRTVTEESVWEKTTGDRHQNKRIGSSVGKSIAWQRTDRVHDRIPLEILRVFSVLIRMIWLTFRRLRVHGDSHLWVHNGQHVNFAEKRAFVRVVIGGSALRTWCLDAKYVYSQTFMRTNHVLRSWCLNANYVRNQTFMRTNMVTRSHL